MNDEPDPGPRGTVRPTSAATLATFAGVALVLGWAVRPLVLRLDATEPQITWLSAGVVWFLAAVVAGAAYQTWRVRRDGGRLAPHRAVNRLVLGKACALVGAVLLGGYAGYAIAHLGVASELADRQLLRSLLSALGGLLVMVAALLLEQACRVRDDPE